MTIQVRQEEDQRRPYAAAANVLAVLDRARRVNLPERINADFFGLVGIPEVSRGRVTEALRFLGITDEDGRPTDLLRSYARAPDDETRDLLAAIVRDAYAEDFARLDPATDPQSRIIAAFRRYQPRSQSPRMVMLFLGLSRAAGLPVLDAPRERSMQQAIRPAARAPGTARPRIPDPNVTGPRGRSAQPDAGGDSLVFDLSQLDLIENDKDFDEVWLALGKARRIIGRARRAASETSSVVPDEGDAPTEGD
ncbi:MAG: DUF5343 domain-containing protein [Candidatus Limnocylindria bacterium]